MNFFLTVRSGRKVRTTFMEEEAKVGIPNLAHRRRHGEEWQSRSARAADPCLTVPVSSPTPPEPAQLALSSGVPPGRPGPGRP
jgi:hypothetical protein